MSDTQGEDQKGADKQGQDQEGADTQGQGQGRKNRPSQVAFFGYTIILVTAGVRCCIFVQF